MSTPTKEEVEEAAHTARKTAAEYLGDEPDSKVGTAIMTVLAALEAAQKDSEPETIAEYSGNDGRRQWWSGGCWLRPGDKVALISKSPVSTQ